MAWHYARYVQAVAAKGKAAYDLPMYVNAWLAGDDVTPGDYPSGGAQPRVIDIWKAAGTAIDIYAPDLYATPFSGWCKRYHRADNPLWIPETRGGAAGAANMFYAFGEHAAMGFSPFGIDGQDDANAELGASYSVIDQVAPAAARGAGQRRSAWISAGQEPSFGGVRYERLCRPREPRRDLRAKARMKALA